MTNITFNQARTIVDTAFGKATELELKPLTVAVLDAGGHLVLLARQDGASSLRPQIAIAKASGALGMGMSSREIADMATDRPSFFASLLALAPRGIVPAAGGNLIVSANGQAIGAVGVTGDSSDNDETCGLAGIDAATSFSAKKSGCDQ